MAHRLLKQHDDQPRDFDFFMDEGWRRLGNETGANEAAKNLQSPGVR
jgi:hypothetical protein